MATTRFIWLKRARRDAPSHNAPPQRDEWGNYRPGKTAWDHSSGAWANHRANRERRREQK